MGTPGPRSGPTVLVLFLSACGPPPAGKPEPGTAPPPATRFASIARQAGIAFHRTPLPPLGQAAHEMVGGGAAWIDYDRDGWVDLFLVNGSSLERWKAGEPGDPPALYRNLGGGRFEDRTAAAGLGSAEPGFWPFGVTVADFDGDGWPDLLCLGFGPERLYRNRGDGSFEDVSRQAGILDHRLGVSAAFVDLDGDRLLDLYIANYIPYRPGHPDDQPNACTWESQPAPCGPPRLEGELDTLWINRGDGSFAEASASSGIHAAGPRTSLGVVHLDLEPDGDQDLLVAVDARASLLWINDGGGRFQDIALVAGVALSAAGSPQAGMGVAIGDYDGDEDEDLYITHFDSDYDTLYRRDGAVFSDISAAQGFVAATWSNVGWGAAFADLDNDGDLDLASANGHTYKAADRVTGHSYEQRMNVFENHEGRFRAWPAEGSPALAERRSFRGSAHADLDRDGDVDWIAVAVEGEPVLVENQGGNAGHWLTLELLDDSPNRFAIGARVRLSAGGRTRLQTVRGAYSYASYNDPRLHWGLGPTTTVDRIEIVWPDGTRESIPGPIAADRELVLRRGGRRDADREGS